jgi:hypothetical protein
MISVVSFCEKRLRDCRLSFLAYELCQPGFSEFKTVSDCSNALRELWSNVDYQNLPLGYRYLLKSIRGGSGKRKAPTAQPTIPVSCQISTHPSTCPQQLTGWNAFVRHMRPIVTDQHPSIDQKKLMQSLSEQWGLLGKPKNWTAETVHNI